jgi:hypothetical protein
MTTSLVQKVSWLQLAINPVKIPYNLLCRAARMIYILGMSHIHPVLDACSINGIDAQLPKLMNDRMPAFIDWETKLGMLPVKVKASSIYIRQVAPHWGPVLARMTEPGVVGVSPGYQNLLASIDTGTPENILFAFMHGEEYHHMSVRPYNFPYDFEVPWRTDLAMMPARQIIPFEIVEKSAHYFLHGAIANLFALRTFLPNLRIVNVICPPPSDAGDIDVPTAHFVRLKNYLVYAKILREATEKVGIKTLLPPAVALTEKGLLRKEYAGDFVHGNTLYGELVVAQMRNIIEEAAK